jgi:phage terminase small subunit
VTGKSVTEGEWGPAMASLATDKQRRFVLALFDENCPAEASGIYAAHTAGFGTPTSSNKVLAVIASRLRADPRIQAAIREVFGSVIHNMGPAVARELKFKIADRDGKDHVRALTAIADRLAPVEQNLTVKLQDFRPPSEEITAQVLAKIQALAARAGLPAPPTPPPPVIEDAEYVEVGE